jgi:hypothetical protein
MKLVSPVETAFEATTDGTILALDDGLPGAQGVRVSFIFSLCLDVHGSP